MVYSSFSTLSYSELKELRSYLTSHIYGCLSKNVSFPDFFILLWLVLIRIF